MRTVVVDAEDLDDDMIGAVIELYEEEKAIMVIVMILMRIRIIVMIMTKIIMLIIIDESVPWPTR